MVLRKIELCFHKDEDGRWPVVQLDDRELDIIKKWKKVSSLWLVYDMRFVWDPLNIYPDLTFDACRKSLSLGLASKRSEDYLMVLESKTKKELERLLREKKINLDGLTVESKNELKFFKNLQQI